MRVDVSGRDKNDHNAARLDVDSASVLKSVSQMSLRERARQSLQLETELEELEASGQMDSAVRLALLGAVGTSAYRSKREKREIPDHWTQIHVLDRLEDGYRVLASQPGMKGRGSSTVWPAVAEEALSLLDKVLLIEAGELEARDEENNRVRFVPTSLDIALSDQALAWPFRYLRDRPGLARAIQLRAMWASMGVDIKKRCRHRKLDHDQFNLDWQHALALITGALIADRVAVS